MIRCPLVSSRFIPLVAVVALELAACSRGGSIRREPQLTAEFGVFFGGQIQERKEIPFELDGTKQTHGFRLTFAEPPAEPHEVSWQLSPPRFSAPVRGKPNRERPGTLPSASRAATSEISGNALMQAGQRELAQVWTFKPGDPLGVWNVRVILDRRILIDRPFLVYDEGTRSRLNVQFDAGR